MKKNYNTLIQSLFSICGFLVTAILLLFSFQLISSHFSPENLSIYLILNTIITIGTALDFGLKMDLIKTVASDFKNGKSFVNSFLNYLMIILVFSIFYSFIIFVTKSIFLENYSNLDVKLLSVTLNYFFIFFAFHHIGISMPFFYEGLNNFKASFILKTIKSFFTNIFPIAYCIFLENNNFLFFIKILTLGNILSFFFMWLFISIDQRKIFINNSFKLFSMKKFKSTVGLTKYIFFETFLNISLVQIINLYVLANFKSEISNSFKIITVILTYINQLFGSMFIVILPIFANEKYSQFKKSIFNAFKLNLVLSLVVYASFYSIFLYFKNVYLPNISFSSFNLLLFYLCTAYYIQTTKIPFYFSSISFGKPQIYFIHTLVNFLICISMIFYRPTNITTISLVFLISQLISYFTLIKVWRFNFK